jgi:hypothetical protein
MFRIVINSCLDSSLLGCSPAGGRGSNLGRGMSVWRDGVVSTSTSIVHISANTGKETFLSLHMEV